MVVAGMRDQEMRHPLRSEGLRRRLGHASVIGGQSATAIRRPIVHGSAFSLPGSAEPAGSTRVLRVPDGGH
jgi:hypothetical protein